MKRRLFIRNATIGYGVAGACIFIAATLFVVGWKALGTFFATVGILLGIDVASAHGHLSKREGDDNKQR